MGQGRADATGSDIRIILERPEFLLLDEKAFDEQEIALNERAISADVFLTDTGASTASVQLDNTDLFAFALHAIMPGTFWWIKFTSNEVIEDTGAIVARRFRVRSVSGYRTIDVTLVSADADLDIDKSKTNVFPRGTISEAVIKLGGDIGLLPAHLLTPRSEPNAEFNRVATLDENFVTKTIAVYPSFNQSKESDASFLTKMAKKVGYVWWVEDETRVTRDGRVAKVTQSLHFQPRDFSTDRQRLLGTLDGHYGSTFARMIGDPEFSIDYEKGVFFGHKGNNAFWSPVTKKFHDIEVNLNEVERVASGQMTPVDPVNQVNFASVTESFQQRKEEADELLAAFETQLVTVMVTLEGRWDMRPRTLVRMKNFGWVVDGIMWVDSIRHRVGEGSVYTCELTMRANAMDLNPRDLFVLNDKITQLQERYKKFEDEVLFSSPDIITGKKFRIQTREDAEDFAQSGWTTSYEAWLNQSAKSRD